MAANPDSSPAARDGAGQRIPDARMASQARVSRVSALGGSHEQPGGDSANPYGELPRRPSNGRNAAS